MPDDSLRMKLVISLVVCLSTVMGLDTDFGVPSLVALPPPSSKPVVWLVCLVVLACCLLMMQKKSLWLFVKAGVFDVVVS